MKLTVVIPMYNESKIIEDSVKKLSAYMQANFESYEIIFSDDGSSDNSAQLVKNLNLPFTRVIGYGENKGKGCAVRHAMLEAEGEIRIFTDADLAYGTEAIGQAYKFMLENSNTDILIGSRNLSKDGYEGYTLKRKLMSKLYIKILCLVGGFKLSDSQCGFKAFRAKAAEDIFSQCHVDGFAFDFEAILHAEQLNCIISEIPVKIINHRDSSVRPLSDAIGMLKDLKRLKKEIHCSQKRK